MPGKGWQCVRQLALPDDTPVPTFMWRDWTRPGHFWARAERGGSLCYPSLTPLFPSGGFDLLDIEFRDMVHFSLFV